MPMLLSLSTSPERVRLIVLILLAVLVGGYLWYLNRKKPETKHKTPYEHLTEEQLNAIPDEELLSAVIQNLLSKTDKRNPQPYLTIPALGEARCSVYCVWLFTHSVRQNGFAVLLKTPDRAFGEMAVDAFTAVGAHGCAAAVSTAISADNADTITQADDAFLQAVESENPLAACVPYIRDNLSLFCDDTTTEG